MATPDRLETPEWGDLDDVYVPSEDSFLLLDTLEEELPLIDRLAPVLLLEVGSGSGVIITALAKCYNSATFSLAVDINHRACTATAQTAEMNSAKVEVVATDLCAGLKLDNKVDLLIFNPPYVATSTQEISGTLSRAWAGGHRGREVTDRMLYKLPEVMAPRCVGYVVAIEENEPEEICQILNSMGFKTDVIARRKVPGEKISLLRFSRNIET